MSRINTSRQHIQLAAMAEGWVTSQPPEDRYTDWYTRHGKVIKVTYNRVGAVYTARVKDTPDARGEWLEGGRAAVLKELRRDPRA